MSKNMEYIENTLETLMVDSHIIIDIDITLLQEPQLDIVGENLL